MLAIREETGIFAAPSLKSHFTIKIWFLPLLAHYSYVVGHLVPKSH